MGFWAFMFIVTLLIPAALLLMWYLFPKLKTIHNASGYRSSRSMKNQDTWDFSQKYCSKMSLYMFFPALILAIGIMPIFVKKPINTIGWIGLVITMIQTMSFIVIMVFTENALKKNFDENENRL